MAQTWNHSVSLCALITIGCCQYSVKAGIVSAQCSDAASRNRSVDAVSLLQLKRKNAQTMLCPDSPSINGKNLKNLIDGETGVLIIVQPQMKCTLAVKNALNTAGISFKEEAFQGDFQYAQGTSDIWDWLHCTYPDDESNGAIMHSYVFKGGNFLGNGFVAADKVSGGQLDSELGISTDTCDEKFPQEAQIANQYLSNSTNKVLLFGWLSCPCVGIAQQRLGEKSVCYEGRQWADPNSKLMLYFQCREKDPESHSFVYFRNGSGPSDWSYAGNGFQLAEDAMSEETFNQKITGASPDLTCKKASVKINVFGSQLEECQVGDDYAGSWMDDGTCSEQTGGVHQICIEALPADFSSETHQSPWSEERKGKRHCVCVGAWSLYMTDAAKHKTGADEIMPHCKAIPETSLTKEYLSHWQDWNGYPASVLHGVKELVSRCLTQATADTERCGLKMRFEKMARDALELQNATDEIANLSKTFADMQCPETADLLQLGASSAPCM